VCHQLKNTREWFFLWTAVFKGIKIPLVLPKPSSHLGKTNSTNCLISIHGGQYREEAPDALFTPVIGFP